MISIFLGNLGSGKTVACVKYIADNPQMKFYTNIHTSMDNQVDITGDMIVKKEIISTKKNRSTGEETVVYKESLNVDYWKNIKEPISVVIDEAHFIMNSRTSMSKKNQVVTEWLALLRRVLSTDPQQEGELILITQLPQRLDVIARDMATHIRYHISHWFRTCATCGEYWKETSEMPERARLCYHCNGSNLVKSDYMIEVYHFRNMLDFELWNYRGEKKFYRHYMIHEIEKYFPLYNTLQWEAMFSA